MVYVIEYEHLKDELIVDKKMEWNFNQVKNNANHYKLELSDDDFVRFLKLQRADKDIKWLMNQMSTYKLSLTDALISYITY